MNLLRSLLPAVLALLAAAAPAQYFRYGNMELPTRATSVIDWNGQPALFIIDAGGGTLARFDKPAPIWGFTVELKVLAIAAIDTRPCAPGSRWDFSFYDYHHPAGAGTIPPGGLSLIYGRWSNRLGDQIGFSQAGSNPTLIGRSHTARNRGRASGRAARTAAPRNGAQSSRFRCCCKGAPARRPPAKLEPHRPTIDTREQAPLPLAELARPL